MVMDHSTQAREKFELQARLKPRCEHMCQGSLQYSRYARYLRYFTRQGIRFSIHLCGQHQQMYRRGRR